MVLGDARLSLEREAPQQFDVLAVDAFSGDSVPVHLITREAMAVYLRHLAPQGIIAFHVTNQFLQLAPVVEKIAADATPVIAVILSGEASLRELTEFADKTLKRNLGTVAGVGQATIIGGRARQVRVVANAGALASLGLPAAQVVQAIQAQNLQLPGGRVEQGARDLSLRTYGRVGSLDDFGEIVDEAIHPDGKL
jgi:hypothetical protein